MFGDWKWWRLRCQVQVKLRNIEFRIKVETRDLYLKMEVIFISMMFGAMSLSIPKLRVQA